MIEIFTLSLLCFLGISHICSWFLRKNKKISRNPLR